MNARSCTWLVVWAFISQCERASADQFYNDFAFWIHQSTAVAGRWLYIEGGEIWARWGGAATASHVWNEQTLAIDLATSWSTANVTAVGFNKSDPYLLPSSADMWYDPIGGIVYQTGGDHYGFDGSVYNQTFAPGLWGFKPQINGNVSWRVQPVSVNGQSASITSNVGSALTATSPTGHYSLGGYVTYLSTSFQYLSLGELLSYNSRNQSWYNQTTEPSYVAGGAQYVPIYGEEGVVLFFGGNWPSGSSSARASLDTILVYDIHTNRFFKQPATNAPPRRYSFCSVSVGTSNNESYEIFMYGGSYGPSTDAGAGPTDLRSVFILTLPAFTWLNVSSALSPTWRADHTCAVIGERHMLSVGGILDNGSTDSWANFSDPWPNGLGIFDMTSLSWTNTYNHTAAPYERGSIVTDFYANNAPYPSVWGDPALQAIFNGSSNFNGSSDSSSSSPTDSGSGTTTTTTTTSSSTGAIVGGVVGGALVLALIAGLIYYLLRRRNRKLGGGTSEFYSSPEVVAAAEMDAGMNDAKELTTSANVHEVSTKANTPEVLGSPGRWHELPINGTAAAEDGVGVFELPGAESQS